MKRKSWLGLVMVFFLWGGAVSCDRLAPGREAPKDTSSNQSSGTTVEVASDPNTNYLEMHSGDEVDMDFNGQNVPELFYSSFEKNGQIGHQFGQYVGQGSGIEFFQVNSIPDSATCKAIKSGWNTGIIFKLDDIYCYETNEGSYGYIHVVKITEEQNAGVTTWTVGFDYKVFGP